MPRPPIDRAHPPRAGAGRIPLLLCALAFALALAAKPGRGDAADRALMRYPTIHGDTIVFEAGGSLWRVSRAGGTAQRLTADRGRDVVPRFSPDGTTIAFTGQYDGNTDVYEMPAVGGAPTRLTFHSDIVTDAPRRWGPDNMVVTWTPDGNDILFLSRRNTFNSWFGRLFLVPKEGGLPVQLSVPKGGLTSFSPDGKRIAYNRIFRNFRTWKSYYGGLAQDIWIYDLRTARLERITHWKGTDTFPMWYRDRIYFASDRGPEKRLNIWVYDLDTKSFRQVTHFESFDVDWPSLGDTGIVFQCGGKLYVLDLPDEHLHELEVDVPSDDVRMRPRWVEIEKQIRAFAIAPNGKRALFGARGEILSVPRKHGNTRNLTQTSGAREQYPAWSPDGKRIAYVTDASGEAQIAVRPADGSGDETIVTHRTSGYLYGPLWSPDSRQLAFSDSDHVLWRLDVAQQQAVRVDHDERNEIHDYSWSPDARWLTYSKAGENGRRSVYIYAVKSGTVTRVTHGENNDRHPVFGAKGRYLFIISKRHENPVISQSDFDVATLQMDGIYVATLRSGEPAPFPPRSDEGTPGGDAKQKEKKGGGGAWKPGAIPAFEIDLQGLASRLVPLPIPAGNLGGLAAAENRIYYTTRPNRSLDGTLPGAPPELHAFDMKERKNTRLISGLRGYALSADGSAILYRHGRRFSIAAARGAHGGTPGDALDLSGLKARIDPVAEWSEMFHQVWRLERDLFYSRALNGVDWDAIGKRYAELLPLVTWRGDLNYVIGEMISELHNSHTYVGGGDEFEVTAEPTGLLGCDFGLDARSGRYTFARIYPGDNTRGSFRSPLTEPGVDVREGMFLLAIDGHELKAPTNPYSLLVNTLGRTVTLSVAESAKGRKRHDVIVSPVANELHLRLKAWIEGNRARVDEASGGKIGYVYLSDMEALGMDEFIRQFYPQVRKQGLIVDVRWNGGGFIDQLLLQRLRRVLVGMATNRERARLPIPSQALHAYQVCLMNHYSGSDGDIFPYFFRKYGLGPLVGTRTWGGVRGIRGYWPLADGGFITIPEESLYGLDSEWIIENHGVEPDVEVDDLPGEVMAGTDAQLETAIELILKKLEQHPLPLPEPPPLLPAYPPAGHR